MTVSSSKRKAQAAAAPTVGTTTADTLESIGIRYSCDYCYKDISNIVRIQCAECGLPCPTDTAEERSSSSSEATPGGVRVSSSYAAINASLEEVDLCAECFAAGVEFASHRRTHDYRILKPLDFAVYREDWRADEELLLLEAVESNGVGNWQDVAEQLGSRTPSECRDHFLEVYLGTEQPPRALPAAIVTQSIASLRTTRAKRPRPALTSSDEAISAQPTPQSVPANHEIAGFMPLRGEFETEWENDAELAIKDLQFTDEDTPAERNLKFAMLDIYTMVLERRAARHAFIFTHGLQDFKKHQAVDKARSREEREVYTAMKPFARFLTANDFQRLIDGLVREEELRRQLSNLQNYRRHGLRSFEEVSAFESERKHLELYLKGGTSLQPSGGSKGPAATVPGKEPFPLPTIASLMKGGTGGSSQAATSISATTPLGSSSLAAVSGQSSASPVTITIPKSTSAVHVQSSASLLPSASVTSVYLDAPLATVASSQLASPIGSPPVTPVNGGSCGPLVTPASTGGRKASTPLNISHAEGVELLSEKERHLCSILRLYPRLYLSIKDTLIREYLKLGGLKRAQARAAVKIDVNKTSKLYDFFVAAGWIKPPASGE